MHAVHREQVMSLRGATKIIAFSASDSALLRRRNSSSGNVGLCKYPLQTMRLVATVQAPGRPVYRFHLLSEGVVLTERKVDVMEKTRHIESVAEGC